MFDENEKVDQPTENKTNEFPKEILELVGADKKYKDVESALKSIAPAQEHIKTLESELQQLREQLEQKALDDLVADDAPTPTKAPTAKAEVDIEALVAAKVSEVLTKQTTQEQAKANQSTVVQAAKKVWGETAEKTLYETASELGLSDQEIEALSAKSPVAAMKLLGLNGVKTNNIAGVPSTVNSASLKGKPLTKPAPPKNWGNDNEVVQYVRELDAYMKQQS